MNTSRPPAVAGMFYPADARELQGLMTQYLKHVAVPGNNDSVPKAIIAPHAGYVYSGPVAASAYARLQPAHEPYQTRGTARPISSSSSFWSRY